RLTAAASARAIAMKARRMILGRFMCGGAPFGGRPSRGACVVGVRGWSEAGEQEAERDPEDETEQEGQGPGGGRHVSGRHLLARPVGRLGSGWNSAAVQGGQLGVDGVVLTGGECAFVDVVGVVVQELPQYLVPLLGAHAFSALLSVLQERGDELIVVGGVGVDLSHGGVILRALWVGRGVRRPCGPRPRTVRDSAAVARADRRGRSFSPVR